MAEKLTAQRTKLYTCNFFEITVSTRYVEGPIVDPTCRLSCDEVVGNGGVSLFRSYIMRSNASRE